MRDDLPSGTVTLLFTDIEGSTKLLRELGAEAYADALAEHRRLLRVAYGRHGGVEVDTQGDAFFYAFVDAREAVAAAEEGREALRPGPIHVRVGIHTGTPHLGPEGYVGHDVHLGARIGAAGHGGQVLVSEATRAAAALADRSLHDLGEHRLKDFDRPVRILQLGAERFPPLKTVSNTNLPRPASSFVGRERETAEIVTLVRNGARLVSLTGPGGSGKTRLSIEAAAELVGDHKAGAFWLGLAPIRDPALVPDEIAKTLGAPNGLAEHIGEREMLLVLDNLEQVIDAAPAIADLVEACPNLAVIATSRERLRVRGEVEVEVQPLDELDAVELFVARAGLEGAGSENDKAVRRLCRALDEMPLAIELAAARAKVLPLAKILERLSQRLDLFTGGRDADARQRTLRSTIAWSHDLLDPAEQRLFARLAVFAGGFTLDAAEMVADADLDALQSLVEKSLVRRTDDRFWLLETIREFALERLHESGDADTIRRRHAEHFLELSEEAEPHLIRESLQRLGPWHERMESELDNIRAALDRFEADGDGERAARMAGALAWFWEQRGGFAEGRRRTEAALALEHRSTPGRASALSGAAYLAALTGDTATAISRAEDALALHRELGDTWRIADAVHALGYAKAEAGDMLGARELFEESVRLFRAAGDEDYAMWSTRSLGWTYHDTGDLARARTIHEENLRRAREVGNQGIEATSLAVLGTILVDEGRPEDALPLLAAGYELHQDLGESLEVATDLSRFAAALAADGEMETAVELSALSDALREELGARVPWIERIAAGTLATAREHLEPAAFDAAWERGRTLSTEAAVAQAIGDATVA